MERSLYQSFPHAGWKKKYIPFGMLTFLGFEVMRKLQNGNCESFVVFYWISKDHTIRIFYFLDETHGFVIRHGAGTNLFSFNDLKIGTSSAMVLPSVLASGLKNGSWL